MAPRPFSAAAASARLFYGPGLVSDTSSSRPTGFWLALAAVLAGLGAGAAAAALAERGPGKSLFELGTLLWLTLLAAMLLAFSAYIFAAVFESYHC
jgi:hypothetical protein